MQLNLGFPETVDPTLPVWDAIDPEAQREFLQTLARVIAKAVRHPGNAEYNEDRHDR